MPALERVEGGAGGCERNTCSAGPRDKSPATVGSSVGGQGWSLQHTGAPAPLLLANPSIVEISWLLPSNFFLSFKIQLNSISDEWGLP